jgi:hypothetical protein
VQVAGAVADDHDALGVELHELIAPGLAELVLAGDRDPVAPEPFALLERERRGVVVGVPGQQRRRAVGAPDGLDLGCGQRAALVTRGHFSPRVCRIR